MTIDPALLSSIGALFGALFGGGASFVSSVYGQRYQERRERLAREFAKREAAYAEFILAATGVLAKAVVSDFEPVADEQRLFGLANRIRLFAPAKVIQESETLIRHIVEISLKPRVDYRVAANEALSSSRENLLLPLSRACREDLDGLEGGQLVLQ
jgi:hypothetical protein